MPCQTRPVAGTGGRWLGAAFAPLVMLRVALYNPLHAATSDRLDEISLELKKAQIVCLPRTTRKAGEFPVVRQQAAHHVAHQWCYKRSGMVNKSAGVSILACGALAPLVRTTWTPPALVQGRGAALRLCTPSRTLDVTMICLYLPPRYSLEARRYKECCTIGRRRSSTPSRGGASGTTTRGTVWRGSATALLRRRWIVMSEVCTLLRSTTRPPSAASS